MIKLLSALLIVLGPLSATADIYEVNTLKEYTEIVNKVKPIVIMFGTTWCSFCVEAKPAFIEADKLFKGKVSFVYMDIDKVGQVSGVNGVPSYVTSYIDGAFNQESLNDMTSRSVEGLVEYVEKYHGVKP